MDNQDIGRIIDEMSANCEILEVGQAREQCCKEQGIACPLPDLNVSSSYFDLPFILFSGASFIVFALLIYFAIKKTMVPVNLQKVE